MAAKAVAAALLADPDGRHWGYSLAKQTNLASGALYPILARMETEQWVASDWENPTGTGPRRRYYQLTDTGRTQLAAFVDGVTK